MNSDATSLQKSEKLLESLLGLINDLFLPSANEVCEGYVFTGVCLSTGGGVEAQAQGGLPRGCVQAQAWEGVQTQAQGGVYPSMHWGKHPPQQTATAADGMHPTGMHSCYFLNLLHAESSNAWHNHSIWPSMFPVPFSCLLKIFLNLTKGI